jgi:hypothetical protein
MNLLVVRIGQLLLSIPMVLAAREAIPIMSLFLLKSTTFLRRNRTIMAVAVVLVVVYLSSFFAGRIRAFATPRLLERRDVFFKVFLLIASGIRYCTGIDERILCVYGYFILWLAVLYAAEHPLS